MSEYLHVEKTLLDQLAGLGWTVIDQGVGAIPSDPSKSLRGSFREWLLPEVFRNAVRSINTTEDGQMWLTDRQMDGSVFVEGGTLLRDLNRKMNLHFPVDGAKTLNGLILEHLQDIPESGTSIKISGYPIEIIQTQDRVVKVARIMIAAAVKVAE
jgi:hypothetical protein